MVMHISRSLNLHLLWKSLGLAVNLIITILIARLLEASVSGQFFYFLSWMSFLVLMASLSLESSITYFIASKNISKHSLSAISLIWIFFVMGLLAIIGMMTGNKLEFISDLPAGSVKLGLCFIAGQLMINYFTASFYGEHEFVLPAKILFFSGILYVIFLLLFISDHHSHPRYDIIISSYVYVVLIQGLTMMLAVLFSKDVRLFSFSFDIAVLKRLLVYCGVAYGANILFFLTTRIDYWFLNYYNEDGASVGNYIQVSRLVQLFQLLPSMLAAFMFPMVTSNKEKMIPYLTFLCRIIVLLDLVCILILGIFGEFLFPFIFGESFSEMYELFLCLTPGIISLSILAILSAYFAGINRVKINMLGSLWGLVFISILNYFLIPVYHVKVAAIVSSIGYTVCLLVAFYFLKKNINFRIIDLFILNLTDIKRIYKLLIN